MYKMEGICSYFIVLSDIYINLNGFIVNYDKRRKEYDF